VQALRPDTRARAFGVAQSGLYAVQGIGILAGGAMAQLIGAPLAMSWTRLRGRLTRHGRTGRRALAPAARSAAC
jgi:hypothetical protein